MHKRPVVLSAMDEAVFGRPAQVHGILLAA